jgi:hypothetical protein
MVGGRGYEVFVLSALSGTTNMPKISSIKKEWCDICDYEIKDGEVYKGVGGNVCTHRICYDICFAGRTKLSARKLLEREQMVRSVK